MPCFASDGLYYVAMPDYLTRKDKPTVPNEGLVAVHESGVFVSEVQVPGLEAVRYRIQTHSQGPDYPETEGRIQLLGCGEEACSSP